MDLKIPFGDKFLRFKLPSERLLGILENKRAADKKKDVKYLVSESLDNVKERLKNSIRGKRKILIVVPDSTRHAHLKETLPEVIKRIKKDNRRIDLIIATGLHKRHKHEQLTNLLGRDILKRHNIICHEQNARSLMNLGKTKSGVPVILNRNLKKYDLIMSIGVIEPHLYAGYSGGAKTIAIGLAGEATINATHGIRFLDDKSTRIGAVRTNSFQKALWDITGRISAGFSLNVVNDQNGEACRVFSGDVKRVFEEGVNYAATIFEVKTGSPSELVICGIGHPKDVNLYQASRAINYILNVKRPILKKGGVLIVAAEMRDGVGCGISETRFYDALKDMRTPVDFVKKIRRTDCIAGVHRAYMVAKALLGHNVLFVTRNRGRFSDSLPFSFYENIEDAICKADAILGKRGPLYLVPRALSTVAEVKR